MDHALPSRPAKLPEIDPQFLALHGIVPLGIEGGRLVVAMAEPVDAATIAALTFAARRPVEVRDGPVVAPVPAQSLFGRVVATFGDGAFARWMLVDQLARLVADGATPAAALARIRVEGEALAAIDWAGPVEALADPGAVARQLRAELEIGLAVRRALALPCALLVGAVLVVGWWGLVSAIALLGFRGVPAVLATARRTGRAVALGVGAIDPVGLTIVERDRLARDRAGVAETVWDRARLLLAAAEGRVMTAMLLMLAMLAVVRLG